MVVKVCKFGGTSLATREQIDKAIDILLSDESRRYMVVSAPGSRYKGDMKVTDLLIKAAAAGKQNQGKEIYWIDQIIERFSQIVPASPHLTFDLRSNLLARLSDTTAKNYEEAVKAFGEYASGVVVNQILNDRGINSNFFDPQEFGLIINDEGNKSMPDEKSYLSINSFFKSLSGIAVIPGFYGYTKKGELITLPRGGSDTSGAIIARGVNAGIYENWTDADGLKRADPRIVTDVETIPEMTYGEARELAYMGFKLQDACFGPIDGQGIVLNVRNTDNPSHPGTNIVDNRNLDLDERIIGVACEKDFVSIGMRKMYIDQVVGFGRKMMGVLEKMKLPYEHTLDGVDTTSLVIAKKYFKEDTLGLLTSELKKECNPQEMMVREMALLGIAGLGIRNHYDVHARTFLALSNQKIDIRMIDEGADDLSFFVGVDNDRANDAVKAVYSEFF
jgi:aspartate kinase